MYEAAKSAYRTNHAGGVEWQAQSVWGRWHCCVGEWEGYVTASILPRGWRAALLSSTAAIYPEQIFANQCAAEAWVEEQLSTLDAYQNRAA